MLIETQDSDDTLSQNLKRLIQIRWWIMGGEWLMLGLANSLLAMPQAWGILSFVLLAQIVINSLCLHKVRQKQAISSRFFLGQICLDILLFLALFYATGGAANPFVYLLLLPLLISAAVLPRRAVTMVAVGVVLGYGWLVWGYQNQNGGHMMSGHHAHAAQFDWHVLGMWLGFVFGVGIVLFFVLRMVDSLRQRDHSLALAREQALRDEQLITLGTLAAGAAHELGTPLATMAVLTHELSLDYANNPDLVTELGVLRQQIDRCKHTLSMLSVSAGQLRAEAGQAQALDLFLQQLVNTWQTRHPNKCLDYQFNGSTPSPEVYTDQSLSQAIINLLDNAAQSSRLLLSFVVTEHDDVLLLNIEDDGPGVPEHLRPKIGKEPVTTRVEGHGLGLLLAHAVIQRLGGHIVLNNRTQGGTQVSISLNLAALQTQRINHA